MFLARDEVKSITDRLLALSKADSCSISIDGGETQSLRFARNSATTNMATSDANVRIRSHIGGRTGAVSTASLEAADLERALTRSEEIARLLPIDPEFVAPLGAQSYAQTRRYDEATGALGLSFLAEAAQKIISCGRGRGVNMFGCATSGRRFEALATSNGLFAYESSSEIDVSATARNAADDWSGWAGACQFAATDLDADDIGRRAAGKAAQETPLVDLEPGRYTVLLEPVAAAELARWLMWMMNARSADEGRSFFSAKGGGTKLGERLFDPKLTIRSCPQDPVAPEAAFGAEGLPQLARAWVENGVLRCLSRSRHWAEKSGAEPVPAARSFVVEGGDSTLEELVANTRRGVLVTRLWYTNLVDPRSLLLTGLTRDGNFLIENGRIVARARNMRFNESLAAVFSRIAALGASARVWRDTGRGVAISAPPMLVEDFEFSSKSSGI
jgi:predicted Zn-dependent protease